MCGIKLLIFYKNSLMHRLFLGLGKDLNPQYIVDVITYLWAWT